MIWKLRRRKSNTLVPRIWKISYLWSRVFELSCRFPRRWGEGKNPDSSSTSRGMIYGKVYGRWIVLARFLIEISTLDTIISHERASTRDVRGSAVFSARGREQLYCSIGRLASRAKRLCKRSAICMRDLFVFFLDLTVIYTTIKSLVIVDAHFLIPSLSRGSIRGGGRGWKKRAIYFHKYGDSRWNFYEQFQSLPPFLRGLINSSTWNRPSRIRIQ